MVEGEIDPGFQGVPPTHAGQIFHHLHVRGVEVKAPTIIAQAVVPQQGHFGNTSLLALRLLGEQLNRVEIEVLAGPNLGEIKPAHSEVVNGIRVECVRFAYLVDEGLITGVSNVPVIGRRAQWHKPLGCNISAVEACKAVFGRQLPVDTQIIGVEVPG